MKIKDKNKEYFFKPEKRNLYDCKYQNFRDSVMHLFAAKEG